MKTNLITADPIIFRMKKLYFFRKKRRKDKQLNGVLHSVPATKVPIFGFTFDQNDLFLSEILSCVSNHIEN